MFIHIMVMCIKTEEKDTFNFSEMLFIYTCSLLV